MERAAMYAGSFDPPTNGHKYVIETASPLFDRFIVAIGDNPDKKPFFSSQERLRMLESMLRDHPNARTDDIGNEKLVDYAKRNNLGYLIRGIRNGRDFDEEVAMQEFNRKMTTGNNVRTIFAIPPPELAIISSSAVKKLMKLQNWEAETAQYVPPSVQELMVQIVRDRQAKT